MISIKTIVFNPFAENTYLLYDETKECVIIDPGCYTTEEQDHLKKVIERESFIMVGLLNTHCHIDHVLGNAFVNNTYNLPLQIPENEEQTYAAVPDYATNYGFPEYVHIDAEQFIKPNQIICFGQSEVKALYVPGHSAGHVAFINESEKICVGGDVLFDGSIGRTDLPGGNFDILIKSIREKLFNLPDDTIVYPGHGPTTTIGQEKKENPFCAIA
jgi:glyoxylase-like metal-dependent hydrolase (beta-lactamase superfamily II)